MKRIILALVALFTLATVSLAGSNSSSFLVYTDVVAGCGIQASSIYFGQYSGGTLTATGAVYVSCNTVNSGYNVSLDAGQNYDGSFYRRMKNGSNTLNYSLYTPSYWTWGDSDFANTYPWGTSLAGTSTGGVDTYTVNAYLWGNQIAPVGYFYYDVVTATVNF